MSLSLHHVDTPNSFNGGGDKYRPRQLLDLLRKEIHDGSGTWTYACTAALRDSLSLLFQYDRLCYAVGNAYWDHDPKLLLNPYMIQCYHKTCLNTNKKPVRLGNLNALRKFLEHRDTHNDNLGFSMQKRF